jgi:hypothetical protein
MGFLFEFVMLPDRILTMSIWKNKLGAKIWFVSLLLLVTSAVFFSRSLTFAFNPENLTGIIANKRSGTLTIYDLKNRVYRKIILERSPTKVLLSRATGLALVFCPHENSLLTVDPATGNIVKDYRVKCNTSALAFSQESNRVALVDKSTRSLSLIQLDNPVPVLHRVTPSKIDISSSPEIITLSGNGFLRNTQVVVNIGNVIYQLAFRFIDHHTLAVTLPPVLRSREGIYGILVVNPEPAGGAGNELNIEVQNVFCSNISPKTAAQA